MALIHFELDPAGIAEVLKSPEFRDLVNGTAVQVAARARSSLSSGTRVEFRPYTTDRRAAAVVIADRRAAGWQERDQVLTRAARAAGLDVAER